MADLLQVLRKTSLTVTETFRVDNVPTDIDSGLPTLAITKPDGTAYTPLPTVSGSWSTPTPRTTGQYRFVLPRQLECTWLDYELTGNIGGEPQTLSGRVEWVGALLFTLSDLRGLKVGNGTPYANPAIWPDAKLMDARTAVLDEFRAILGFHPVPRFCRETKDGDGSSLLVLTDPGLQASKLLTVTADGAAKSTADYTLKPSGILVATSGYRVSGTFPDGVANVTVEYVAGRPRVVGEGWYAAMVLAAKYLDPSGFSNAATVTTPDGVSYAFEPSEVGRTGFQRHTGIRDLDRWLNRHSQAGALVA